MKVDRTAGYIFAFSYMVVNFIFFTNFITASVYATYYTTAKAEDARRQDNVDDDMVVSGTYGFWRHFLLPNAVDVDAVKKMFKKKWKWHATREQL